MLNIESLKSLIISGKFGWYMLQNQAGTENMGGSHLGEKEDSLKAFDTEAVVTDLEGKLNLLPDGNYKIILKKSPQTNKSAEVVYRFSTGNPQAALVQNQAVQSPSLSGVGYVHISEVDQRVKQAVTESLASEMDKFRVMRELDAKDREIERLKEQLHKRNQPTNNNLEGLYDVAKMGIGVLISHFKPEALPAIQSMMGYESESKTEEQKTFKRPE